MSACYAQAGSAALHMTLMGIWTLAFWAAARVTLTLLHLHNFEINNMKLKRLFTLIILILFLIITNLAVLAEEIGLTASVDKDILTIDDTLKLTITISGSQNTPQPQFPRLEGLSLIFGPSISTKTSIINGAVSVSKSFNYVLKPISVGIFTIGEFVLEYDGKLYKSNKIDIEVVNSNRSTDSQKDSDELGIDKRIFIEFTTDKKEAYIYEQIIATFKLFFQRGLSITDLEYIEPETRNFTRERLGEQRQYEELRNGVVFNVIELKTGLFPVISGRLQISPARFKCNLIVSSRQRGRHSLFDDPFSNSIFDEFFGVNQGKYPISRESEPIELYIKPLPATERPDDFNGAVGDYTLNVDVRPTNVKVGDPITLTMNVKGQGNIQSISEPKLIFPNNSDFKDYPSETKLTITDRDDGIKGEKLFSKVIEPQSAKITQTPAISFSFFNPQLEKYQTILSDPIPISVEASKSETPIQLYVRDIGVDKEEAQIITKDILPIMTNLAYLKYQGGLLYKNPYLFPVFIVPIVAFIASLFVQKHRDKLKTDASYARKRQAYNLLKKGLTEIKKNMAGIAAAEFYTISSKTLSEYLANKLNLSTAIISPSSITGILEGQNVSKDTIKRLVQLLEMFEYVRFSMDETAKEGIHGVLAAIEEITVSLEKELK